jgi:hypothetical protein
MVADFGIGLRHQLGAGSNQLRIPPGRYRLRMYSQLSWMRVAKADMAVEIRNEPLTIYYATPYTVFNRGAVGLVPQQRPIKGLLVGLLTGAVLVLLGLAFGLATAR